MSALSYIQEYGDDEDTLSEESDREDIRNTQRTKLPAPNLSGVPVVSSEDHIDDPSFHNGCIRSFPHVRGNWATFIYIDYPDIENLSPVVRKLENFINSTNELCIVNELPHISLSKTFVLRFHMIQSFTTSLQAELSNCGRFYLNFDDFEVYCNEEKTRTFLALKVDTLSYGYLYNLMTKIDGVFKEYKLPTFYEDPSFHMSLLSLTGDKKEKLLKIIHNLNDILIEQKVSKSININRIHCKSGNKVYQYYLN